MGTFCSVSWGLGLRLEMTEARAEMDDGCTSFSLGLSLIEGLLGTTCLLLEMTGLFGDEEDHLLTVGLVTEEGALLKEVVLGSATSLLVGLTAAFVVD